MHTLADRKSIQPYNFYFVKMNGTKYFNNKKKFEKIKHKYFSRLQDKLIQKNSKLKTNSYDWEAKILSNKLSTRREFNLTARHSKGRR